MRRRLLRRLAALTLLALTACTSGARAPAPVATPTPAPTPVPTPATPPPEPVPVELPTPRERVSLEGTVTYLQRTALTPEAVVQVELRDATVPDAPPIAKLVIQRPGQVPVAFSLSYEPGSLLPVHRYVLSARISDRGQLQFVTEQPVAAIPKPAAPLEIVVVPVQ